MRVADIRLVNREDACQLQARVESDRNRPRDERFESFTVWYRFPARCGDFLSPENGDPFLAALLPVAMMTGQPLVVDAPVSPALLWAVPEIQAIYLCFARDYSRVEVTTPARTRPLPPLANPARVGLFFSLGVDSFYSLLKNVRDHPVDADAITDLITVDGFDVFRRGWETRSPSPIVERSQTVARGLGKALLPVATNLRYATESLGMAWSMSHGAALASVVLALGNLFRRVHIAASTTYDQLYPLGTHPVLDRLWSTEDVTFVHDGCELGRIDKVRLVAQSQLALDTLRVCPGHEADYNCGRCIKCLPTMIDLLQTGALDRCRTLPHTIDVEALRRMLRVSRGSLNEENYRLRYEAFGSSPEHTALRAALGEYLAGDAAQPAAAPARSAATADARRSPLVPRLLRRRTG